MSHFVSQQSRNVTVLSGDGPSGRAHRGHDLRIVRWKNAASDPQLWLSEFRARAGGAGGSGCKDRGVIIGLRVTAGSPDCLESSREKRDEERKNREAVIGVCPHVNHHLLT